MEYFTYVGSYDGAIKMGGRWVGCNGLNRIDKRGWRRVQPTPAAHLAAKATPRPQARDLFPGRALA